MIKKLFLAVVLLSLVQMPSDSASRSRRSSRHRSSHALVSLKGRLLVRRDYVKNNKHTWFLYSMKPDGSDQRRLLPTKGDLPHEEVNVADLQAIGSNSVQAISPDGQFIALASSYAHRDAFNAASVSTDIYLYTVKTGATEQLTDCGYGNDCLNPRFSPDGKKIVFSSGQWWSAEGGYFRISVMNRDGSGKHFLIEGDKDDKGRISTSFEGAYFIGDGSKISYMKTPVARYEQDWRYAYVMNSDGSKQTRLPEDELSHRFSRDGKLVAFAKVVDKRTEIFVRNMDGTQERIIAHFDGKASITEFSPSDNNLLIMVSEAGSSNIYLVAIDGSTTKLIAKQLSPSQITFSRDGRRVAFSSKRDGDDEIFVADLDGSKPSQLTKNTADDAVIGWL